MLKRSFTLLAVLALVGFAVPTQADAQATIYIGGGGSFPTSDFGDYANTGWMAIGGVLVDVGPSGLGLGVELFYGQNNHKDEASLFESAKTSPYGAMAIVDSTMVRSFSFSVSSMTKLLSILSSSAANSLSRLSDE